MGMPLSVKGASTYGLWFLALWAAYVQGKLYRQAGNLSEK